MTPRRHSWSVVVPAPGRPGAGRAVKAPCHQIACILGLWRSKLVASCAFVLELFHDTIERSVDVELKDGRKRIFVAPPRMSLMELLDDVSGYLASAERTSARTARARSRLDEGAEC